MTTDPTTDSQQTAVRRRVLALAGALTAIGVPLAIFASVRTRAPVPLHFPIGALFLCFIAAAAIPFNLEVGRNGFALSLSEIPLVIGLLSTSRPVLIASGVLGYLLAKLRDPKVAKHKLVFNVPLELASISLSTVVFDQFHHGRSLDSPKTWAILLLAIASSCVLSTSAVNLVISFTGDALKASQVVRHSLLTIANATLALGLTLVAVLLLNVTPAAVILVVLLAALVITPLRRYALLERRFSSLQSLHEFTSGLTRSKDLSSTLTIASLQAARILRSESAEVVLANFSGRERVGAAVGRQAPFQGDPVWRQVLGQGKATRLSQHDRLFSDYLVSNGLKDLMAAPLRHNDDIIGMLVVRDRKGDVSSFDENDLTILQTMADQTTITLQNLRLIDRLRDEAESRKRQALHDDLTGLPNRTSLALAIHDGIDNSDGVAKLAVLLLDLNRFKGVNDTLGHHAGDEVLVEVARRLLAALPSGATVARLGGDEFAITLSDVESVEHACGLAEGFQRIFDRPIEIEGMSLRLDASIGVSLFPDHGLDGSTLMRRSDVAMYAAKAERGAVVCAYDPSQEHSTTRQLTLIADLRNAVENENIVVLFQPKANIRTKVLVGVEALVRWKHPTFGAVSPDEFVPLAEQSGFIGALTDIVLRRSLELSSKWHKVGIDLSVAVNLDASTLRSPDFVRRVEELLSTFGVPPRLLTFEITEREIVGEIDVAAGRMNELRGIGVKFSIDDFGTGFSSLGYLSKLPIDEVKIDRSFVFDVAESRRHAAIVRAVTDIAGSLGLTTVAEGVEDQACWDALGPLGCDVAQGWYLARAMTEDELAAWHQTSLVGSAA